MRTKVFTITETLKIGIMMMLSLVCFTDLTSQCTISGSSVVLDAGNDCQETNFDVDVVWDFAGCNTNPSVSIDVFESTTPFNAAPTTLVATLVYPLGSASGSGTASLTTIAGEFIQADRYYQVRFTHDDATATTSFTYSPAEFNYERFLAPALAGIACNDAVNVSLDANCRAEVNVDMFLEGDACAGLFEFAIQSAGGVPTSSGYGGTIVIEGPGTYSVTVTNVNGENCWGDLVVEDKLPLELDCGQAPINVFCSQEYYPGAPIDTLSTIDTITTGVVGPVTTGTESVGAFTFSYGSAGASPILINDIKLRLDLEMPNISDLSVYLANDAFAADTIKLLDFSTSGCNSSNLDIYLFDDALIPYSAFLSPFNCGQGVNTAYCGDYQALNSLSNAFTNDTLSGDWTVIVKNRSTTDAVNIDNIIIEFTTFSSRIPFPLAGMTMTEINSNQFLFVSPNSNCGPYDAVYEDFDVENNCEGDNWRTIDRVWTVTNPTGIASTCTQRINVINFIDLAPTRIVWPQNFDGLEGNMDILSCSALFVGGANGQIDFSLVNADTLPLPALTGYPQAPFGDISLCGNAQFQYNDTRFDVCGRFSFKVLREWTLLDWCTSEVYSSTQVIKVQDNEGPVITCAPDDPSSLDDFEIFTNSNGEQIGSYFTYADPSSCTADWLVKAPLQVFDCNQVLSNYEFDIAYLLADDEGNAPVDGEYISTNVTYDGSGNPVMIRDLPFGRTWVRYTIADDCGNATSCFTEVTVRDNTVPTPVCIEQMVLSFGSDGCAIAPAEAFDKNSYDNCGVDSFAVRRLDIAGQQFGPKVKFCCEDWGNGNVQDGLYHEVELKVIDRDGNENTCIVLVTLQDPIDLVVTQTPPNTVTVGCTDDIPTPDQFIDQFVVVDNLDQSICPYTVYQNGPIQLSQIDECGNGRYEIWFIFTSHTGFEFSHTIDIIVENDNPFDPNTDVDWSTLNSTFENTPLNDCPSVVNLDPANTILGEPTVSYSDCGLIAQTYEDQVFDDVQGACAKILRTWTVIDWCTYDPSFPNQNIATYVQVIKIDDSEAPVFFDCNSMGGTISSSSAADCSFSTIGLDDNGILILDESEGFDTCSDMLGREVEVTYTIDYHSDGTIDVANGVGRDANGVHEYGCHIISWQMVDHCDNVSPTCAYTFCIEDTKPPTPYCRSSIVTVTMPVGSGGVDVWASEFDLGSYDNVTGVCNNNPLIFTLTNPLTGESGSSLTLDCDDMPNGVSATIELQLWVEDEFGNRDYCNVTVILEDNANDSCSDAPMASRTVAGNVRTENDEMLENSQVSIVADGVHYDNSMMTQNDGHYAFDVSPNQNYVVNTNKEDNILNGVSTLDLVLIQKHILSVSNLDSPYKVIAADADRSGTISAIDLVTIRKVILGINNEFPNDEMNWRCIDAQQSFVDPLSPFPYQEAILLDNVTSDMANQDFIAIKIGDVNGSAQVNSAQGNDVESRNGYSLDLFTDVEKTFRSETVIPVHSTNFEEIVGFQFTIKVDSKRVNDITIESGQLELTDANVSYANFDEGIITVSWNTIDAVTLSDDDTIFNIVMNTNESQDVANLLEINSDLTTAEAYNNDLVEMDLNFSVRGGVTEAGTTLFQNTPNPFTEMTEIQFNLSEESFITLNVFDVSGKLLKTYVGQYGKGMNTVSFDASESDAQGVLYYTLETESFTQTRKMVIMR